MAADFFTTEVWTARGLVTYYTVFVIELQSRRVHVVGSTPYPDEAFVVQAMRDLTNAIDGVLATGRVLICDRDRKWSRAVLEFLEQEGVRIIRTPFRAPNCNAYAERFVRSIKEECLESRDPARGATSSAHDSRVRGPLPRRAEPSRHRQRADSAARRERMAQDLFAAASGLVAC